jgi:hypothetical protein
MIITTTTHILLVAPWIAVWINHILRQDYVTVQAVKEAEIIKLVAEMGRLLIVKGENSVVFVLRVQRRFQTV